MHTHMKMFTAVPEEVRGDFSLELELQVVVSSLTWILGAKLRTYR